MENRQLIRQLSGLGAFVLAGLVGTACFSQGATAQSAQDGSLDHIKVKGPGLFYKGATYFNAMDTAKKASADGVITGAELQATGACLVTEDSPEKVMRFYEQGYGTRFVLKRDTEKARYWRSQTLDMAGFRGSVGVVQFLRQDPPRCLVFLTPPKELRKY